MAASLDLPARLASLDEVSLRVASPWPVLDRLTTAVAASLWSAVAVVGVLDERRHVGLGAYGLTAPVQASRVLPGPNPLCRQVTLSGRPVVVQDARRRGGDGDRAALDAIGIVAYAGMPLVGADGHCVGALAVFGRDRRSWTDRDLDLLRVLAEAAVTTIERRRAELRYARIAEDDALHDELTGLLNRRGFSAVAERCLAVAARTSMHGLLFFLDLDGLKRANDRGGHAVGDRLLRDAAEVLRRTFRGADTIARIGGDEFVVLAIDATPPVLATIADRLAAEVQDLNRRRGTEPSLAWSIGTAPFDPAVPSSLAQLLEEADGRMYVEKAVRRTIVYG